MKKGLEKHAARILIVDDHEENLRVLAGILGPSGYDLVPAKDGYQVFDRLKSRLPDLILLDVVMPGMSGVEVCKKLKENDDWADIPVIFLSAADDKEMVVEALESGGVDYIAKPFNQAELLTRVSTHLSLKQTRDRLALLADDKDQMLRVMTHDFKNQVSGVLMSARLLMERKESQALPERSLKLVRNIGESSERMMEFLKSFLANQEAASQELKVRGICVEEILRGVIAELEPSAILKGTKLLKDGGTENWEALGDEQACRQIFENLIGNAVKFCPKGSCVEIQTGISEGSAAGRLIVEICDNGPGFSPEDKSKMFKRYSRLSARPSGGEPSSGLGLYIAKVLLVEMGGEIDLTDQEKGAGFRLSFRARPKKSSG